MSILRKPLEKAVEQKVVKWARTRGLEAIKLNGIGQRSWPDRLFLGPAGKGVFVEFKRAGKLPTPLQEHAHALLRSMSHTVEVFDDAKIAIEYLDGYFNL